MGVIEELEALA